MGMCCSAPPQMVWTALFCLLSHLQRPSRPFSSWRPRLLPSANIKISLARHEQGHWVLSGLSENQGGEACPPSRPLHQCALTLLLPHPRRPHWPPASSLQLHSCVHSVGLFYLLAKILPPTSAWPPSPSGSPEFWGPCQADLQPQLPVYFLHMVCLLLVPLETSGVSSAVLLYSASVFAPWSVLIYAGASAVRVLTSCNTSWTPGVQFCPQSDNVFFRLLPPCCW